MCIRDKVRDRLSVLEHVAEKRPMPFTGMHNPHGWLIHPALNARERLVEGKWMLKDTGVGADSDESSKDAPTKTHRRGSGQLSIPPFARSRMMWTQLILSVEKDIGVHKNH